MHKDVPCMHQLSPKSDHKRRFLNFNDKFKGGMWGPAHLKKFNFYYSFSKFHSYKIVVNKLSSKLVHKSEGGEESLYNCAMTLKMKSPKILMRFNITLSFIGLIVLL